MRVDKGLTFNIASKMANQNGKKIQTKGKRKVKKQRCKKQNKTTKKQKNKKQKIMIKTFQQKLLNRMTT